MQFLVACYVRFLEAVFVPQAIPFFFFRFAPLGRSRIGSRCFPVPWIRVNLRVSRLRCCAGRARVAHVHYSSCFFLLPPRVVGGRPTCVPGPASPWQHAALPPHLGSSRSFVARSSSEPPPLAALPPIWFVCSPYFGCALFFPFLGAAGRTPQLRSPPPQAQARLISCGSGLSCS